MTTAEWVTTLPELQVFAELVRRGKKPGADFTFRPSSVGGRPEKQGYIVDFLFLNPPDLAMSIHTSTGAQRSDIMTRAQLASEGIKLIFLDEDMVAQDVQHVVGEALKYRDLSRR